MQMFIKNLCLRLLFANCDNCAITSSYESNLLQIVSLGWGHKVVRVWWGRSKNTRDGSCHGQSCLVLKVVGLVEQKRLVTRPINFMFCSDSDCRFS